MRKTKAGQKKDGLPIIWFPLILPAPSGYLARAADEKSS
jgi:hypothetical protein